MKKLTPQYKISDKPGFCNKSDTQRAQSYYDFFNRNYGKYDVCVNTTLIKRDGDDVYKIAKKCGYTVQSKLKGVVHFTYD